MEPSLMVDAAAVDHAVRRRRYWALILGFVGLPGFPVGLLLPAFALYEAHLIEATRGLQISAADVTVVIAVGQASHRLKASTVRAVLVRDLLVVTGETEAGPKSWSLPVGADGDSAAVATLAQLGITVQPRHNEGWRDVVYIFAFVVLDRGLVMVAGVAVFGAVLAFIGAALGHGTALWGVVPLGGALGALVLRASLQAWAAER